MLQLEVESDQPGFNPKHSGPEWLRNIQKLITFLSMGIFSNRIQVIGQIKREIRILVNLTQKVSLDQSFSHFFRKFIFKKI